MTATPDPVRADEFVLRRVHKNHCSADRPRAVHLAAFRPSREDASGLSVFREAYISAAQVAASGRKRDEYVVVRLAVQDLARLGLTVLPDEEVESVPGHAVIPQLSLTEYERDKQ